MDALCILCMENSTDIPLVCGHVFHTECMAQVFKLIDFNCPMCRLIDSIQSTGSIIGWKFVEFVNSVDPGLIRRFLNDTNYEHVTAVLIRSLVGAGLDPGDLFDVGKVTSLPFLEFIKYVHASDKTILKRFASHAIGYGHDGLEFITVCFLIEQSVKC